MPLFKKEKTDRAFSASRERRGDRRDDRGDRREDRRDDRGDREDPIGATGVADPDCCGGSSGPPGRKPPADRGDE